MPSKPQKRCDFSLYPRATRATRATRHCKRVELHELHELHSPKCQISLSGSGVKLRDVPAGARLQVVLFEDAFRLQSTQQAVRRGG